MRYLFDLPNAHPLLRLAYQLAWVVLAIVALLIVATSPLFAGDRITITAPDALGQFTIERVPTTRQSGGDVPDVPLAGDPRQEPDYQRLNCYTDAFTHAITCY